MCGEAAHPKTIHKPAYARYIGVSGNNFLSNTWRADSEASLGNASLRMSRQSLKCGAATKVLPTAKNLPSPKK
jgi:hypothetical protein